MKIKYLLLLLTPFFLLIFLNEGVRFFTEYPLPVISGIKTLNTVWPLEVKCTWYCHRRTDYCQTHHVKFLRPYFEFIDPLYFGIIKGLKATGNYRLANIFFLAIGWPLLLFFLLIQSMKIEERIRQIKNANGIIR